MEVIRLSTSEFREFKEYKLEKQIENTESIIYIYNDKELLKVFKNIDSENMINKSFILSRLFYLKDQVETKNLVLPNSLVRLSNNPIGYTMDHITDNINLGLILNDNTKSIDEVLFLLKQVANILKMTEISTVFANIGFHLGDIHEGNFIYDKKDRCVKAVDLDSAYIPSMQAPNSKYLTFNDKLWDFPYKYPLDQNNKHIPNHNTTIISFIYMILNYITGEYVPDMSISSFCECLNMLASAGFEKELLDQIFAIYCPKDNYFDYEYLNSITSDKILKYRQINESKYSKLK